MKRVYLDHNATTPPHPDVVRAMLPYFEQYFGNASSVHGFGREAKKGLEDARAAVAALIGAKRPDEIVFTSGGTEADNFAIRGAAQALKAKGGHIITSSVEHPAVGSPCRSLEKDGCKVTYLPVDQYGIVDLDALKRALTDKTVLVTVMYANNETGAIEPLKEIVKIAKEKGVLVHTDAVQAAGKIEIDVDALGVDLLSLSGHKFYGPKGAGALYIRHGVKIAPIQLGGHHEKNRRAGTENVPGIVGMGEAARLARRDMAADSKRIASLRDSLEKGIEKTIRHVRLNGHSTMRLPNTSNMSFEYLEGESILLNLDMEGVAVSTGSACTSGSLEPSHVLTAMKVPPVISQGSIRFSLGRINTAGEIGYVLEKLPPIIERLRKMSPLYAEE